MKQEIYYIKFALRFAEIQIPELVSVFNSQVKSRAWSSMRGYHDLALTDEFQRRGIDTSDICNGDSISFAHPIAYNICENKLILLS